MSSANAGWSAEISERIEARRTAYGGSDRTDASYLRPQYVKYNTISKSQDFGELDNLLALVAGAIGGSTGAQTLYFRVKLRGAADLRITRIAGNPREDQYISLGILGPDRKPIAIGSDGFAALTDIGNTPEDESQNPVPPGEYTFTISSSQWQSLPYAVLLQVLRFRELSGAATLEATPTLRIARVRLSGLLLLSNSNVATLLAIAEVVALQGAASGGDATSGTLTIPRGQILMTMSLVGQLRQNWRLVGTASGQMEGVATLSVGGGSGYG